MQEDYLVGAPMRRGMPFARPAMFEEEDYFFDEFEPFAGPAFPWTYPEEPYGPMWGYEEEVEEFNFPYAGMPFGGPVPFAGPAMAPFAAAAPAYDMYDLPYGPRAPFAGYPAFDFVEEEPIAPFAFNGFGPAAAPMMGSFAPLGAGPMSASFADFSAPIFQEEFIAGPMAAPVVAAPAVVPPVIEEAWVPEYAGPSRMLENFASDIKNVVQMKSEKVADNFHKAKKQ